MSKGLSIEERSYLMRLAFFLTISARNEYPAGGEQQAEPVRGMRAFNEMLHDVLGRLLAGSQAEERSQLAQLKEVLSDHAKIGQCEAGLKWALSRADSPGGA